jgi:hypothetical protein
MNSDRSNKAFIIAGITGISAYGMYKLFYYLNPPHDTSKPKSNHQSSIVSTEENKNEVKPQPLIALATNTESKAQNLISHSTASRLFPTPVERELETKIKSTDLEIKSLDAQIKLTIAKIKSVETTYSDKRLKEAKERELITQQSAPPSAPNALPESNNLPVVPEPAPEIGSVIHPANRPVVAFAPISPVSREEKKSVEDDKLLEHILCPITSEIMTDPVTTAMGQTYERSAIEAWFRKGKLTDPITNVPLLDRTLTPNFSIKSIIDGYRKNQLHFIPIDNKITKEQLYNDINKTIAILSPLETYANKTGLSALTKHHQPEAKKLVVELRVELGVLKRCNPEDKNEQVMKIISILENHKTKNKHSGFTIALQGVVQAIKKHYLVTEAVKPSSPAI